MEKVKEASEDHKTSFFHNEHIFILDVGFTPLTLHGASYHDF